MNPLCILYRDASLIAVDKPPGLLVHRSMIDRHETRFAVQLVRDAIGQHVWPVHRLDKGTSGVLLFALSQRWAAVLGRAFEAGEVDKRYLALVRGWPQAAGSIDHPLLRLTDDFEPRVAAANRREAQPALTRYLRLGTVELDARVDRYATARYALVALAPRTGRAHQLRRHLKHIAHPIIGDATYGKGRHNRLVAERIGARRLWLHAVSLAFPHPASGELMSIEASPGQEWGRLHGLGPWHWDTPWQIEHALRAVQATNDPEIPL